MPPAVLDQVLRKLPQQNDPNLLVGFTHKDDAGVYKLSDDLALVQTTDFFTPIVDDPYAFGQVAAANSLSDVYAMGGEPLTALSIVCFPEKGDLGVLEQILAGGLDKMNEAGCTIVGGHTIRDDEIKFGYAITGRIHPDKIWANTGARPGDKLLLTKPLGTGVITTALRKGAAKDEWIEAVTATMARLNRDAARALLQANDGVHTVTDITGFGLLGHAHELATGSKVSLRLDSSAFEWIDGALECAAAGHLAGGLKKNREFIGDCIEFAGSVSEDLRNLLYDPQTSGGLLAAVAPGSVEAAQKALRDAACSAMLVGEVVEKTAPLLAVR